ncbi:MAG: GspMb/PilO family protein [Actinomycetota bacterium]|nr:GspMb/PilO family protein [Actinomycetota bacterium]
MTPEQIARNRAVQAELYGQPLSDLFRHLADALQLNQAGLAHVLGLSQPMLSQLISAQRVKIGNPAVLQRVQSLGDLAGEAPELKPADLRRRIADVANATGGWSSTSQPVLRTDARHVVRAIQALLRSTASAAELQAAARRLEDAHPGVAEFLRVYGTGHVDAAAEHYARIQGLR